MKIIVGLSGGVDSSVAAYLLKQQGYDVEAMFMQNWHDITGTLHGECEWEEEKLVAEMVAKKIGIPFHFVDLSDDYRKQVVDYMFSEYAAGRTPNPDVLCNSKIKFDSFLKKVEELGGDFVATGHYCKKETVNIGGKEIYRILAGDDPNKDQSYFLCQLSQQQLSKALFPIGHLAKPQVREIARQAGLPSAEKKDSQGICFVGKVDLPVFLQQYLKQKEGNVVEIFRDDYPRILEREFKDDFTPIRYTPEDGKVIGKHIGVQYYTIGQRHGLNIGGHQGSIFIIATDISTNTIYVGEGKDHPGLFRKGLVINPEEVHWIREDMKMQPGEERRYLVRIRYRQPLQRATLKMKEDGMYILFDEPQRGITPGQFAAWYSEDGEMLGSGPIKE
ncbi:MAG: tRNA 2-thiouridine(34) synthase MnmA [Bacteroidales bacterium]|jgi:tRNA-specific 2-thiouridylase|nr:tRNA 2-thiouridine(34) synthase MnmA [Bacteroidales bacterium]